MDSGPIPVDPERYQLMSRYQGKDASLSTVSIRNKKKAGQKISMVTCYDAAFARLVDASGIDMVLVGDSLGNVMLGFEDTTKVTLEHMIHHSACVSRVIKRPVVCADMPFLSYNLSTKDALQNAGQLVQKGGAQCVKIEGGRGVCPQVGVLVEAGIPVMGHLGLTPQKVHLFGGYRVQGRGDSERKAMLEDARALERAGAFALVLELVPESLAAEITRALDIPVIGIGAGPHCDGQVLVLQDLLGFDDTFNPKFLRKYARLGEQIEGALKAYDRDVKSGHFPDDEHSF